MRRAHYPDCYNSCDKYPDCRGCCKRFPDCKGCVRYDRCRLDYCSFFGEEEANRVVWFAEKFSRVKNPELREFYKVKFLLG